MNLIVDNDDHETPVEERIKKENKKLINYCIKESTKIAIISGLLSGALIWGSQAYLTREINPKRIVEYYQLENKIFRGKKPLADIDKDGRVSRIEESSAYAYMGIYYRNQKHSLEDLRNYVKMKESERE